MDESKCRYISSGSLASFNNWCLDTLGIDVNRIAIGGGSAGGALAAALALLVRDRREFKVALQVLIYPTLDDRETYREGRHPKYVSN